MDDARHAVQAGSKALGPCAGVLRGKEVDVGDGLASMPGERRITMMVEVLEANLPVSEKDPLEGNKKDAQIQQTVLVDEMGNEVLTWEGTGNPVAQADWD
jgi:hypothetical protein